MLPINDAFAGTVAAGNAGYFDEAVPVAASFLGIPRAAYIKDAAAANAACAAAAKVEAAAGVAYSALVVANSQLHSTGVFAYLFGESYDADTLLTPYSVEAALGAKWAAVLEAAYKSWSGDLPAYAAALASTRAAGFDAKNQQSFRWKNGDFKGLDGFPASGAGLRISEVKSVSGDGSVIVGASRKEGPPVIYEAVRWTKSADAGFILKGLGGLGSSRFNVANAVSDDGSVIAGRASKPFLHMFERMEEIDLIDPDGSALYGEPYDVTVVRRKEASQLQ